MRQPTKTSGPACAALVGGTCSDVPPLFQKVPPFVPPHTPGFRHTSTHVRALVKATSHREKEKGRKLVEASGLICGARGRNRTGTPCGGGFSYHFGFRRRRSQRNGVRGLEHAFTIALSRFRCPPSALYTFRFFFKKRLGSVLARTCVQGLRRV